MEDEMSLNQCNLNSMDSASETHSPRVKRAVVAKKINLFMADVDGISFPA